MSTRAESCDPAGPRLPIQQPVDPIGLALGAALRCMTDEDWIAVCDSYLNSHRISVPDIQAELGLITGRTARLLDRTDGRSQSGTESIVRVRLRNRRFTVVVQPRIAGSGMSTSGSVGCCWNATAANTTRMRNPTVTIGTATGNR